MAAYTSSDQVKEAHATLVNTFKSGKTKSLAWRKWQLKQIWWMIEDNEQRIINALHSDLHRDELESYLADIGAPKTDILLALDNVERWSADQIPDAGILFGTICKARIRQEPLGVALIMSAWNFPFLLIIQPLIAAITAGCCVMLKPSEVASACQNLIAEIVPKYLDNSAIHIVTGGVQETTRLLEFKFDMIFYTGSATGKSSPYISTMKLFRG